MRKVSKFQVVCVGVLVAVVLAGVAWAADPDPALAAALASEPSRVRLWDASILCFKQIVFDATSLERYSYDSEGDQLARKYIEAAKARGNVVRVYGPAINAIICQNMNHPAKPASGIRVRYDGDRALIEFDKSGRIVSYMARAAQASKVLGRNITQYTLVYLGAQNARQLENLLNNRILQDNFLREM